uniref:hypothetical protein n=1 Tax=Cyanobium sp. TaxID=2164130 RepID=UPI0040489F85
MGAPWFAHEAISGAGSVLAALDPAGPGGALSEALYGLLFTVVVMFALQVAVVAIPLVLYFFGLGYPRTTSPAPGLGGLGSFGGVAELLKNAGQHRGHMGRKRHLGYRFSGDHHHGAGID